MPLYGQFVDPTGWTVQSPAPTVTSGTGTFTGATITASGRYKQIGKTVFYTATVTLTAIGSGSPASYLQASLPAGMTAAADSFNGSSQEKNVTGKAGSAQVLSGSTVIKGVDSSGVTFIANGAVVTMSGTFEIV
jgi:hypothetical protein